MQRRFAASCVCLLLCHGLMQCGPGPKPVDASANPQPPESESVDASKSDSVDSSAAKPADEPEDIYELTVADAIAESFACQPTLDLARHCFTAGDHLGTEVCEQVGSQQSFRSARELCRAGCDMGARHTREWSAVEAGLRRTIVDCGEVELVRAEIKTSGKRKSRRR